MTKNEYISLIVNYGDKLIARRDDYEIPAASDLKGMVGVRVHNQGSDDTGKQRNYRSQAYMKRFNKNNPVSMVQYGDLLRDYNIYKNGADNVLGFRTKLSIDKILSEEKRREGGTLYGLTEGERARVKSQITRFVRRIQKETLNV